MRGKPERNEGQRRAAAECSIEVTSDDNSRGIVGDSISLASEKQR